MEDIGDDTLLQNGAPMECSLNLGVEYEKYGNKKSSILKPPRSSHHGRNSSEDNDCVEEERQRRRSSKRVSFAEILRVKEFRKDDSTENSAPENEVPTLFTVLNITGFEYSVSEKSSCSVDDKPEKTEEVEDESAILVLSPSVTPSSSVSCAVTSSSSAVFTSEVAMESEKPDRQSLKRTSCNTDVELCRKVVVLDESVSKGEEIKAPRLETNDDCSGSNAIVLRGSDSVSFPSISDNSITDDKCDITVISADSICDTEEESILHNEDDSSCINDLTVPLVFHPSTFYPKKKEIESNIANKENLPSATPRNKQTRVSPGSDLRKNTKVVSPEVKANKSRLSKKSLQNASLQKKSLQNASLQKNKSSRSSAFPKMAQPKEASDPDLSDDTLSTSKNSYIPNMLQEVYANTSEYVHSQDGVGVLADEPCMPVIAPSKSENSVTAFCDKEGPVVCGSVHEFDQTEKSFNSLGSSPNNFSVQFQNTSSHNSIQDISGNVLTAEASKQGYASDFSFVYDSFLKHLMKNSLLAADGIAETDIINMPSAGAPVLHSVIDSPSKMISECKKGEVTNYTYISGSNDHTLVVGQNVKNISCASSSYADSSNVGVEVSSPSSNVYLLHHPSDSITCSGNINSQAIQNSSYQLGYINYLKSNNLITDPFKDAKDQLTGERESFIERPANSFTADNIYAGMVNNSNVLNSEKMDALKRESRESKTLSPNHSQPEFQMISSFSDKPHVVYLKSSSLIENPFQDLENQPLEKTGMFANSSVNCIQNYSGDESKVKANTEWCSKEKHIADFENCRPGTNAEKGVLNSPKDIFQNSIEQSKPGTFAGVDIWVSNDGDGNIQRKLTKSSVTPFVVDKYSTSHICANEETVIFPSSDMELTCVRETDFVCDESLMLPKHVAEVVHIPTQKDIGSDNEKSHGVQNSDKQNAGDDEVYVCPQQHKQTQSFVENGTDMTLTSVSNFDLGSRIALNDSYTGNMSSVLNSLCKTPDINPQLFLRLAAASERIVLNNNAASNGTNLQDTENNIELSGSCVLNTMEETQPFISAQVEITGVSQNCSLDKNTGSISGHDADSNGLGKASSEHCSSNGNGIKMRTAIMETTFDDVSSCSRQALNLSPDKTDISVISECETMQVHKLVPDASLNEQNVMKHALQLSGECLEARMCSVVEAEGFKLNSSNVAKNSTKASEVLSSRKSQPECITDSSVSVHADKIGHEETQYFVDNEMSLTCMNVSGHIVVHDSSSVDVMHSNEQPFIKKSDFVSFASAALCDHHSPSEILKSSVEKEFPAEKTSEETQFFSSDDMELTGVHNSVQLTKDCGDSACLSIDGHSAVSGIIKTGDNNVKEKDTYFVSGGGGKTQIFASDDMEVTCADKSCEIRENCDDFSFNSNQSSKVSNIINRNITGVHNSVQLTKDCGDSACLSIDGQSAVSDIIKTGDSNVKEKDTYFVSGGGGKTQIFASDDMEVTCADKSCEIRENCDDFSFNSNQSSKVSNIINRNITGVHNSAQLTKDCGDSACLSIDGQSAVSDIIKTGDSNVKEKDSDFVSGGGGKTQVFGSDDMEVTCADKSCEIRENCDDFSFNSNQSSKVSNIINRNLNKENGSTLFAGKSNKEFQIFSDDTEMACNIGSSNLLGNHGDGFCFNDKENKVSKFIKEEYMQNSDGGMIDGSTTGRWRDSWGKSKNAGSFSFNNIDSIVYQPNTYQQTDCNSIDVETDSVKNTCHTESIGSYGSEVTKNENQYSMKSQLEETNQESQSSLKSEKHRKSSATLKFDVLYKVKHAKKKLREKHDEKDDLNGLERVCKVAKLMDTVAEELSVIVHEKNATEMHSVLHSNDSSYDMKLNADVPEAVNQITCSVACTSEKSSLMTVPVNESCLKASEDNYKNLMNQLHEANSSITVPPKTEGSACNVSCVHQSSDLRNHISPENEGLKSHVDDTVSCGNGAARDITAKSVCNAIPVQGAAHSENDISEEFDVLLNECSVHALDSGQHKVSSSRPSSLSVNVTCTEASNETFFVYQDNSIYQESSHSSPKDSSSVLTDVESSKSYEHHPLPLKSPLELTENLNFGVNKETFPSIQNVLKDKMGSHSLLEGDHSVRIIEEFPEDNANSINIKCYTPEEPDEGVSKETEIEGKGNSYANEKSAEVNRTSSSNAVTAVLFNNSTNPEGNSDTLSEIYANAGKDAKTDSPIVVSSFHQKQDVSRKTELLPNDQLSNKTNISSSQNTETLTLQKSAAIQGVLLSDTGQYDKSASINTHLTSYSDSAFESPSVSFPHEVPLSHKDSESVATVTPSYESFELTKEFDILRQSLTFVELPSLSENAKRTDVSFSKTSANQFHKPEDLREQKQSSGRLSLFIKKLESELCTSNAVSGNQLSSSSVSDDDDDDNGVDTRKSLHERVLIRKSSSFVYLSSSFVPHSPAGVDKQTISASHVQSSQRLNIGSSFKTRHLDKTVANDVNMKPDQTVPNRNVANCTFAEEKCIPIDLSESEENDRESNRNSTAGKKIHEQTAEDNRGNSLAKLQTCEKQIKGAGSVLDAEECYQVTIFDIFEPILRAGAKKSCLWKIKELQEDKAVFVFIWGTLLANVTFDENKDFPFLKKLSSITLESKFRDSTSNVGKFSHVLFYHHLGDVDLKGKYPDTSYMSQLLEHLEASARRAMMLIADVEHISVSHKFYLQNNTELCVEVVSVAARNKSRLRFPIDIATYPFSKITPAVDHITGNVYSEAILEAMSTVEPAIRYIWRMVLAADKFLHSDGTNK